MIKIFDSTNTFEDAREMSDWETESEDTSGDDDDDDGDEDEDGGEDDVTTSKNSQDSSGGNNSHAFYGAISFDAHGQSGDDAAEKANVQTEQICRNVGESEVENSNFDEGSKSPFGGAAVRVSFLGTTP